MPSAYEIAPIFLIRMAGVPFEILELMGTPETCEMARQVVHQGTLAADQKANIDAILQRELYQARVQLTRSARTILPNYLLFGGPGARELAAHLHRDLLANRGVAAIRNSRAGDRERHILLYLQRIAAKNDTFSEFGASGWGKTADQPAGIALAPVTGIARRDAFFERWVTHGVCAVINADPENSNPQLAVPALEPHAFETLCNDVAKWPPGPGRDKWLPVLTHLADLPQKFKNAESLEHRGSILEEARLNMQSLGAERKSSGRFLYAATNPIGEECFRECHFEINESLINEVATESEPWIDFWRDTYAFVSSRVATVLRGVMEQAGGKNGAVPLPAFLQACESAKLPLMGPGLIAPAVMAFQEVKAAFRRRLQAHADSPEYELTPEDCQIIRNTFEYPKFDEYTYPSADLQLAADSPEAVSRGDYEWILAELHPPISLMQHCMYWACPDKVILGEALRSTTCGRPNFHFGFFAAELTAHTTVCAFDAIPQRTNFIASQRANSKWRKVLPSDTEVYVDAETGDVCLRKIDDREYLGSFARAWVIPLGFHPFQFSLGAHTPRLRCGKVIVQRRAWTITKDDLIPGNYTGVSTHLVIAVEKLRAEKGLPRYVYIRPTEQALRRSGAEGRDKDTKPVFIDLESYLFLEIFHRWIVKAGEIEVTEMLPRPDQLLWKEPDGHRTFELRTLIVPRS